MMCDRRRGGMEGRRRRATTVTVRPAKTLRRSEMGDVHEALTTALADAAVDDFRALDVLSCASADDLEAALGAAGLQLLGSVKRNVEERVSDGARRVRIRLVLAPSSARRSSWCLLGALSAVPPLRVPERVATASSGCVLTAVSPWVAHPRSSVPRRSGFGDGMIPIRVGGGASPSRSPAQQQRYIVLCRASRDDMWHGVA